MDSIKFIKGYGQVNPNEHQSPPNNHHNCNRKPLVAVVSSLIIVLTLIIGIVIAALIHESTTEPPDESPSFSSTTTTNSTESIRAVCSVTQYPDSCFTTISSSITNNSSKADPEVIFVLSLKIAITELGNLSSLPKTLISKSNDPGSVSALNDCASLFDEALSRLNDSAKAVEVGPGEKVLTEEKVGSLNAWITAAMTDQETCLDGLEEMKSTVIDEVKAKVQKSKECMSNSLAILAHIQTLLVKFHLTMH